MHHNTARKLETGYMPLRLKRLLQSHGVAQNEWAAAVRQSNGLALSKTTANQLLNWGAWPRNTRHDEIVAQTGAFLAARAVPSNEIATAFEIDAEEQTRGQSAHAFGACSQPDESPEIDMFLAPVSLHPDARKKFGLFRNPFADDLPTGAEVYRWPDFTYALEAAKDAAVNHRFVAIVGQSGSGKSTLVESLRDEIQRLHAPVTLIEPYVMGMEVSEAKGTPMKSTAIADAILGELAPHEAPAASHQRRYSQVVRALQSSMAAGNRHLLLIEEAHAMPPDTLRELKRWREVRGQRLMGILLIGQDELKDRLNPRNAALREVVQRCEMVTLLGLEQHVDAYIKHRLGTAGKEPEQIFAPDAFDAIREILSPITVDERSGRRTVLRMYPLAINNLIVRAMNAAYKHFERVTAAAVRQGAL